MGLLPDARIARRIVVLGAPVILAMLSQTAINLVDTIFVGRLGGRIATAGQSALGISIPLFWAFGGFCAALGVGTQAIVARRHGENDPEAAGAALANSVALSVLLSVVVTAAGWFLLPSLLRLMHDDPEVRAVGTSYARLRFLGILSMVGTFSLKAFYDGTERTWVHLVASLALNATNIVLAWLLVFGRLGFPRMEVEGAGIAALIASYVGLSIMAVFTLRPGDRRKYRPYRLRSVRAAGIWAIARLSFPSGIATAVVMTGFLIVLKIVGWVDELTPEVGAVHTAATKIIMDIMSVCFIGCLGLGTATATLLSKSLGEKDPQLAERYGRESLKLGICLFGALGILEAVFPDAALGVFTSDPRVVDAARDSLRLMASLQAVMATCIISSQCLFGAGNTRYVMVVEGILHFGVMIPLSYLLGVTAGWGVFGVWLAAAAYIVALALATTLKFLAGGWKAIRI